MPADKGVTGEREEAVVGYVHTVDFPALLETHGISLIVSTYQAQRTLLFYPQGDRLMMLMRTFDKPTGMAIDRLRLALCTRNQIWFFHNAGLVRNLAGEALPCDVCFVPRRSHVTGDIAAHEIVWHNDQIVVVNTRFSCLSTLATDWSFVPIWKPRFVSEFAADDRCHLNGLCLDAHGPKYVTALGETNLADSWRENKLSGGCVIDVPSGEIAARNLCMPHSPRIHRQRLWVLESGTGSLVIVDPMSGRSEGIVQLPGYLRGLALFDNIALIGLSKIREKYLFGGLPLEDKHRELECAVYAYDIERCRIAGFIKFTKGIEEIFGVEVIPQARSPHMIGFVDRTIDGIYVIPPGISEKGIPAL